MPTSFFFPKWFGDYVNIPYFSGFYPSQTGQVEFCRYWSTSLLDFLALFKKLFESCCVAALLLGAGVLFGQRSVACAYPPFQTVQTRRGLQMDLFASQNSPPVLLSTVVEEQLEMTTGQRQIHGTASPPETNLSGQQGRSEAQQDGENVQAQPPPGKLSASGRRTPGLGLPPGQL